MSDFKDNPKQREAYLAIMQNLQKEFEKTGKLKGKKFDYWSKHSSGDAIHYAHRIANGILKRRYMSKERTNQDLLADLEAHYKKTRRLNDFNHPDWKHVHSGDDID